MAGQGALATGAAASERVVVLRRVFEGEEDRHRPLRHPHRRVPTGDEAAGRAGVGDGAAAQPVGEVQDARLVHRHGAAAARSEEHTSELQSLMRISYAVFCLKKKKICRYKCET